MSKLIKQFQRIKSQLRTWAYSHILPPFDKIRTMQAVCRLSRDHCADGVIKVGFIAQMPQIWNKQASVYEKMVQDSHFEPWLVVVPSFNSVTKQFEPYGSELLYFRKAYPDAKILTADDLGGDFRGIKRCGFHYIFLARCWEAYIPKALRTRRIIQFAKTCYIPYAFHCFQDPADYYQTRFFNSLYVMFSCTKEQTSIYSPDKGRKSVYLGFPCLSQITFSPISDYSQLRILWTPRWDTDLRYGGTSFYDYKDKWVSYAQAHPSCHITFRPHPLTFEYAQQSNRMTAEEIRLYLDRLKNSGIETDKNASIDVTLQKTDVMVTDFSSVIIDAFLSGKILVYCGKPSRETPNQTLQSILDCSYHAETWSEVENILGSLQKGIDPLRASRETLAQYLLPEHLNSDTAILSFLIHDQKLIR